MATCGLVLRPATIDFHGSGNLQPCCMDFTLPSAGEAIEIYLFTLGSCNSVMPLKISTSDTIASVKMRIQAYKGVYVKQQRLIYGGRELCRNDSLVKDYGLSQGELLHLVLRLSDLQNITIKTTNGKEHVFKLQRSKSVKDLKQKISNKEGGLALGEQQLVLKGENLDDDTLIDDLSLGDDSVVHLFVRSVTAGKQVPEETSLSDGHIEELHWPLPSAYPIFDQALQFRKLPVNNDADIEPASHHPPKIPVALLELVQGVKAGIEHGYSPLLSSSGSGGVYFMQDEYGKDIIGVFKPMDEEPMAINNPRGLPLSVNGEGLKRGTRVGEGAYREVAAYILDHPLGHASKFDGTYNRGFSDVPPTLMVRCSHKAFFFSDHFEGRAVKEKVGSLQQFVHSISNCEDMGPAKFPVQEVHKICVLDIRLVNTDRNGGNILVCKLEESSDLKLIPIDHGYCFPDKFEDCTFEWLYWPQARIPFQQDALEYIGALDAENDIALLRDHGWELLPDCARVFRVATLLLKKGASAGLTPHGIGSMMCRESLNRQSAIERMVEEAEMGTLPGSSEKVFMETLSEIMEQHIRKAVVEFSSS